MARRKLDRALVLDIYRLRGQGKSIDGILKDLREPVARGTVAKYTRLYDAFPEELRVRDLPFNWREIEKARVPWEAAEWVLSCCFAYEASKYSGAARYANIGVEPARQASLLSLWEPFTNRWATWCWRVHQVAPTLSEGTVLAIAAECSLAEQVKDLEISGKVPDLQGLDDFLRWQPWRDWRHAVLYEDGLRLGLIAPIPSVEPSSRMMEELVVQHPMSMRSNPILVQTQKLGWRMWWEEERSELLLEAEKEFEKEDQNARQPSQAG